MIWPQVIDPAPERDSASLAREAAKTKLGFEQYRVRRRLIDELTTMATYYVEREDLRGYMLDTINAINNEMIRLAREVRQARFPKGKARRGQP